MPELQHQARPAGPVRLSTTASPHHPTPAVPHDAPAPAEGGMARRAVGRLLVGLPLLVPSVQAQTAAADTWPATVVKMEDLKPLNRFVLRVPGVVNKGRVVGPTVLRTHVDEHGSVVRVVVLEGCGNADLDEAALHAMRVMRFEPYLFGGTAEAVTLVVPIHMRPAWGR